MKRVVAALVLALAVGSLARAVEIPDTPAGRALSMYVGALNSADSAKLQAYIDTYHRKSTVQDYLGLHDVFGNLSVLKVEKNEPNHVEALLATSTSDDVLRATFETDPADAAKLTARLEGVDRPAEFAIPRLTQAEALAALNAKIDALAAQDKYMGVLLIEDHGKILLEKAWGYGDREAKVPLKVTDKFRLGSMNKMFTAVAALQLVAQGKLRLDGTVGRYLIGYPNKDIRDNVTIGELLSHSGGTGDIFGEAFDKHRLELKTLDDYVKLYAERAPEFPPGTDTRYSNYGYILLGVIIQKVSGQDYYEYLREHIFLPAGMTDTGSLPETDNVPGRVKGYMQKDGKWVPNTDTLPWRGTSAGGGYSTLRDLLRFAHAMMNGKLLPNDLRDAATRSEVKGDWYGYGFEVHGSGPARNYGHSGGAPGMSTEMRIYPDAKTVVIELGNIDPPTTGASFYGNRMPLTP